ncbi:MAG TPA: hypothetical protein VEY92_02465, partial [Pseudoxanthomonas sp.]|nr:hypothetical protein [Pseudoxanthomonas sp.]
MIQSRALPAGTDLLALHRRSPSRYPLLLESVASGTAQGRWDLLLAASGTGLRLGQDGMTRPRAVTEVWIRTFRTTASPVPDCSSGSTKSAYPNFRNSS